MIDYDDKWWKMDDGNYDMIDDKDGFDYND